MRLLLDTHIWIDSASNPQKLGTRVRREISSTRNELWVSPISAWELLKLAEKGKLKVRSDPIRVLERLLQALPVREAPITMEIARETAMFTLPHRDPADIWLVATARVHDLVLATRDEKIITSGVVKTLAED